jgi:hypothetical protein
LTFDPIFAKIHIVCGHDRTSDAAEALQMLHMGPMSDVSMDKQFLATSVYVKPWLCLSRCGLSKKLALSHQSVPKSTPFVVMTAHLQDRQLLQKI